MMKLMFSFQFRAFLKVPFLTVLEVLRSDIMQLQVTAIAFTNVSIIRDLPSKCPVDFCISIHWLQPVIGQQTSSISDLNVIKHLKLSIVDENSLVKKSMHQNLTHLKRMIQILHQKEIVAMKH